MPEYRRIFPSYDWDDAFLVNQIINLPFILGSEEIGFTKGVPNEEVKKSDAAIQKWIDENMHGCSCLILFVGEKTYLSKWCKYEIEQALERKMGSFIIYLEGLKDVRGICKKGADPYKYHNMYSDTPGNGYTINPYSWPPQKGVTEIKDWIEDACQRAGR